MITTILFDMDGLLIDSEPFWRIAETEVFAQVGIRLTDAMCQQTMGWRFDEVVRYWYGRYPWTGLSVKEVENRVIDRIIALVRERGKAMAGVHETLSRLKKEHFPLALASSSAKRIIDAVLQELKLADYFNIAHSAENEPYGKPHPAIFLSAAKMMDAEPTSCLVIEDSLSGVIAAKAARMKVICVPDPAAFHQPQWSLADRKLSSLLEFDPAILSTL